jgi:ABC-type nitrate/sulfonate/bicarbonate transport system substrate-binding protein
MRTPAIFLLPLCAVMLAAAGPRPAAAADRADGTVRLGYFIGGRTILFGRAFADGAFEREGVKIELTTRRLRGGLVKVPRDLKKVAGLEKDGRYGKMKGGEILALMAAGELDGGLVGEASFIEAAQAGQPVVAVALLGHDRKDEPGHAIVLRKGVVISSAAGFAGLTMITRRAGPGDALFFREFLRKEGVPESSVKIIDQVDDDQIEPMLKDGRADGGYLHLMLISHLLESGGVYVYRPMNWLNAEVSQALLVFRRDFLEKRRSDVLKIVAAYAKRVAYENALPGPALEGTYRRGKTGLMKLDSEDMSLPVYDYPPKVRMDLVNEMQGMMLAHGLLKGTTDLGLFVDTGAVDEALKPAAGK